MAELDTKETAERRRLAFFNLCNGVPVDRVAHGLCLSQAEVMRDFDFVARKLRSYMFERKYPHIPCDTVESARRNRLTLLPLLEDCRIDSQPGILKPRVNCATNPKYSRIHVMDNLTADQMAGVLRG